MNAAVLRESFDGFVAMSGAAKAWGMDRMLAHYQIDMPKWTQIAGHWTAQVGQDPLQYGGYGIQVECRGRAPRHGWGASPGEHRGARGRAASDSATSAVGVDLGD